MINLFNRCLNSIARLLEEPNEKNLTKPKSKNSKQTIAAKNKASSKYYYENRDIVLDRQKKQKAKQRKKEPWISRAANAKSLAKKGGYLGTVTESDTNSIREMYKEAHKTDRTVRMIIPKEQGGLWQLNNLQLKIK